MKAYVAQSKLYAKKGGYTAMLIEPESLAVWFNSKLAKFKRMCEWCGESFGRFPTIDHDHVTGEVRALVCKPCNMTEGRGLKRLELVVAAMKAWAARPRPEATSTSS
jgi:hypothetical protein